MWKSRFTEEQIIGLLKQAEVGVAVVELCRSPGANRLPAWATTPECTTTSVGTTAWNADVMLGKSSG